MEIRSWTSAGQDDVHSIVPLTYIEGRCGTSLQIAGTEHCLPSLWSSSSFIMPKKYGTVWLIIELCQVNQRLHQWPFPIPTLINLLDHLHGFSYVTALDLFMGYYHIPIEPASTEIHTTILQWGHYAYLWLPMGISVSADIFHPYVAGLFMDVSMTSRV